MTRHSEEEHEHDDTRGRLRPGTGRGGRRCHRTRRRRRSGGSRARPPRGQPPSRDLALHAPHVLPRESTRRVGDSRGTPWSARTATRCRCSTTASKDRHDGAALPHHRWIRRGRHDVPGEPRQGPPPDRRTTRPQRLPARPPGTRGRRHLVDHGGPGRPGEYRVFADFHPLGRRGRLHTGSRPLGGRPLPAPGRCRRRRGPHESTATRCASTASWWPARRPGYAWTSPATGNRSRTSSRTSAAYGHLVALRDHDLAYLHVHPDGEPAMAGPSPDQASPSMPRCPRPETSGSFSTSATAGRSAPPTSPSRGHSPAAARPPTDDADDSDDEAAHH